MAWLRRKDRHTIETSGLLVMLLRQGWERDREAQHAWRYALQCGTPVRLLVAPGVEVPADAFAGLGDLKLAQGYEDERDLAQVLAWVEELKERENDDG